MRICFIADANHFNTINWTEYFANELGHQVHIISFNKPFRKLSNVHVHRINYQTYPMKLRYFVSLPCLK